MLADFEMVAVFILCCLIGYYLLDSLAKVLNVKNLGDQVPAEFVGIYEPDRYRESQRYLRTKTRFELVSATFDLVCLLVFWGLGGFERLDIWLRSIHQGPVVTGILYLGVLGAARELLELPFEAYATFVIEQRFGFNRATLKTFVLDRLKGWALAGLLMVGFLTIVLNLLERFGLADLARGLDNHGNGFNSADVSVPNAYSATLLQVFSLAGRTVTGRHFGLLSQTKVPAPGPFGHRRLTSFIEGKRLLYRLRKEQTNRALRHAH